MMKATAASITQKEAETTTPTGALSDAARAEKAERIRAALRKLGHLRISTEEYLREKHAELAREQQFEDA